MDGLQRILDFLELLRKRKITSRIEQQCPDAIMVSFTLVGMRVEVDFFVDSMVFSYFSGTEEVYTDLAQLQRLIDENWD